MILFFYGPNSYVARQKLRETQQRYRHKNGDLGLEKLYGPETTLEQVIGALTTVPFLATSRLVVIEELSHNKPVAEAVIKAINRVSDSTNVIFYETNPDQRTSFFKSLKKLAKVVEFKELESSKLRAWVQTRAAELGGSIDGSGLNELLARAGPNQWRLEHELQKLINYQPSVTSNAVIELVEPQFASSIFDLVDAIVRGNTKQAVQLYRGLRANREEPLYIMSMIGWQLHNLLVVKAAGSRSPLQVAKEAGINPYVINKAAASSSKIELASLKQTYRRLLETDYKLKSTSTNSDVLVEDLIVSVAGSLQ